MLSSRQWKATDQLKEIEKEQQEESSWCGGSYYWMRQTVGSQPGMHSFRFVTQTLYKHVNQRFVHKFPIWLDDYCFRCEQRTECV